MSATTTQLTRIKALANGVLSRNQSRNFYATNVRDVLQQLDGELSEAQHKLFANLFTEACRGVTFPDGSPFTPEWLLAQLDPPDFRGILEDDGPVSLLRAAAQSFASHPWDLRSPGSRSHQNVTYGNYQQFVPDSVNPAGGTAIPTQATAVT